MGQFLIGPMLMMNGSDHLRPQPALGRVVAEANALQDDYRFEITSLPEYLPTAPTEGLARWQGELRSGARANVLMGVTSNRIDVKMAAAATERALERRAEPWPPCSASRPAGRPACWIWPGSRWCATRAHDSICACSVDEVVDAVLHRFAEARQIAEGWPTGPGGLARSMADPGPVAVNLPPDPAAEWSSWWSAAEQAAGWTTSRWSPSGPSCRA